MAQITQAQRVQRIQQLLSELNRIPPERHETERLPGTGGEPLLCEVIKIGVDEVLLNHRSHRIRAQLEDDPEWSELSKDPHSEASQKLIERHVRTARSLDDFKALKESLLNEGQTHPGVMTHDGVLVNANTRVVAIREFEDPSKRYVRVAVLPATISQEELSLLELRLQMQKELKVDYSLTNELLFIEELSAERRLSNAQIARELRLYPESSSKKGESEVAVRLRLLDLVRDMQTIPKERLPLTFFDILGYQQLRDVQASYAPLLERSPAEAQRYLESFLLSVAVGVTPVHQIRNISPSFMSDYMLPQLEEDEVIGPVASSLATGGERPTTPPGVSELAGSVTEEHEGTEVDLKKVIDMVTQRDKRVSIPGSSVVTSRDDVRDAIKGAIITGIKEKRRDASAEDKLEAPGESVKNATKQLARCLEAFQRVHGTSEFDARRQRSLEAAFKRLKRTYRQLETALAKAGVVTSSR